MERTSSVAKTGTPLAFVQRTELCCCGEGQNWYICFGMYGDFGQHLVVCWTVCRPHSPVLKKNRVRCRKPVTEPWSLTQATGHTFSKRISCGWHHDANFTTPYVPVSGVHTSRAAVSKVFGPSGGFGSKKEHPKRVQRRKLLQPCLGVLQSCSWSRNNKTSQRDQL